MTDLSDELGICMMDFVSNVRSYKEHLHASGTPHFAGETQMMAEKELEDSGINVLNCIKKYYLQLTSRTKGLLGENAPCCNHEIKKISSYLSIFEDGLTEVADLAIRTQNQTGQLCRFFSSAYFLETYTARNRNVPTNVNTP